MYGAAVLLSLRLFSFFIPVFSSVWLIFPQKKIFLKALSGVWNIFLISSCFPKKFLIMVIFFLETGHNLALILWYINKRSRNTYQYFIHNTQGLLQRSPTPSKITQERLGKLAACFFNCFFYLRTALRPGFLLKVKQFLKFLVQSNTQYQGQFGSGIELPCLNGTDGVS